MHSGHFLKQSLFNDFHIDKEPIISPKSQLYFIGSCFSQEISQRFHERYVLTEHNPFGTLFTPQSIRKVLEIISGTEPVELTKFNEAWHFLDGAYRFHGTHSEKLKSQIDQIALQSRAFLEQSEFLFITLGTSIYYEWIHNARSVANCHKIPQDNFLKKQFSTEEVEADLNAIQDLISEKFPHLNIIYTVSPVRHLRDGIRENSVSKSILDAALHEHLSSNRARYFPSYEIFTDELRDLRFFKPDLMHPNEWATDYIFTRLLETYGTTELFEFVNQADKIRKFESHKNKVSEIQMGSDWNWEENRNRLLGE